MDRPSIAELHALPERYRPVLLLRHDDIAKQLQPLLFARDFPVVAYWLVNALMLGALVWLAMQSRYGAFDAFSWASLGGLGAWVLLLPVHEHIHALAYRWSGASDVTVHYQLRKLMAYCVADRFVVAGRQFLVVCLAPLVVIDALLLALLAVVPADGPWRLLVGGALLLHTGAASGDVALANLLWRWRSSRMWTYDDVASGESHFFVASASSVSLRTT